MIIGGGISRLALGLCAGSVVVSCGRERLASPAASSTAVTAQAGSAPLLNSASDRPNAAAASASTPPLCAAFTDQQKPLAKQWPAASVAPDVLGRCYSTRSGGAWVYPFDSIHVDAADGELTAHFSVAHLARGPSASEPTRSDAPFISSPFSGLADAPSMPAPLNYIVRPGFYQTDLFAPVRFDFDGDGEEEFAFSMQAYVDEGHTAGSSGQVLTFKGGTVSVYPAARGLLWFRTEDVDHDGRPDLLGSYSTVEVLFHSLPDGTFSANDSEALSYARRSCPPSKRAVFLPAGEESTGESVWNGPCARLWGASEQQVLAQIDKHCRPNRHPIGASPAPPPCEVRSVIDDRVVESAETYRRDARLPPPLLLTHASAVK